MGLLDGLEKLINEHGSAAILKERIELANDKYAALERKAAELSAENDRLRAENAELRAKLPAPKAAAAAGQVDDVAQQILVLLSKSPRIQLEHIAGTLGIDRELAAFHIEELEGAGLVYGSYSMIAPANYSLDQEGRRYLIKNGLLK